EQEGAAGKSIVEKAAALAKLIAQTDALREQAIENLSAAATSFEQAATAATSAKNRLTELGSHDAMQNSRQAFTWQIDATNAAAYRVRQAEADAARGDVLTKYAAGLK